MIIKYLMLQSEDPYKLAELVNEAIGNSWQPHGSLAIEPAILCPNDHVQASLYNQPMVITDE